MLKTQLVGAEGILLGHRSVDEMGRHEQPVSPQNYEIWLTYFTHAQPEVRQALDRLISSGKPITEQEMEDLYERFFSTTHLSTQVMETGSRIAHEIADALDALKKAGATTERYGATLNVAADSLANNAIDGDALKRLISVLASATTEMSKQNTQLSHKLAQSSQEMEKLRQSLRQARAEALTDGLTGVANRKLFDETLRLRKEEADQEQTDLSLILCDIDHFKSFNDTWGHQTGDQVIRFVASTMNKFALPDHLVARYGGEEFAIIMPAWPAWSRPHRYEYRTSLHAGDKQSNDPPSRRRSVGRHRVCKRRPTRNTRCQRETPRSAVHPLPPASCQGRKFH
jgi:diguanylate cyclase